MGPTEHLIGAYFAGTVFASVVGEFITFLTLSLLVFLAQPQFKHGYTSLDFLRGHSFEFIPREDSRSLSHRLYPWCMAQLHHVPIIVFEHLVLKRLLGLIPAFRKGTCLRLYEISLSRYHCIKVISSLGLHFFISRIRRGTVSSWYSCCYLNLTSLC